MALLDRIEARAERIGSLLCVGLDPHPAYIESAAGSPAAAARRLCERLIELTAAAAVAFKPNVAFFEALGPDGLRALVDVVAAVPDGIPVILDAKRGDVSSTAEAYAAAAFSVIGADAVTLSPYLGRDAVEPFLRDPERGAFVLCRTSNPGAAEVQELPVAGPAGETTVFETVARHALGWSAHRNVGLVVGATAPCALLRVRRAAPEAWILAPGVGAQGGDLAAALQAGLREDGMGVLVAASRSIAGSPDPGAEAARLRDAIDGARRHVRRPSKPARTGAVTDELAGALLDSGCVRFGQLTLKSGLTAPIYIDLRRLVSAPALLAKVAEAYLPLLRPLSFQRLAALPYAALPIGTAVSLRGGWPMVYPRREVKEYGTKASIEGLHEPGDRAVALDDLTTTGGSKLEALDRLRSAGMEVEDVVVLIDRESGAREALTAAGLRLHAVWTLTELLDCWERMGKVAESDLRAARAFVAATRPG